MSVEGHAPHSEKESKVIGTSAINAKSKTRFLLTVCFPAVELCMFFPNRYLPRVLERV